MILSIGLFAYIAASAQELVSASLIKVTQVGDITHYDFTTVQYFWIGSAIVSMILATLVWNAKKVTMD